jgi:GDP-L-fucose synthase
VNNVLITGGAGFVGRAFTKRLLRDGCRVTIIDDLSTGIKPREHPNLIFQKIDAGIYFRHTINCEFDTVFHLAAVVGGRLKIEGDPLAVATDLSIDASLFNWISRVPKKPQLIYFSSSAAYPIDYQRRDHHRALKEEFVNPTFAMSMPDQTYGLSKFVGEYLAQVAAKQYDVDVKIYRPFSGYGPDQSFDYPFPSVVNRVLACEQFTQGLKSKKAVVVWGSGDQLRDFIYIADVVDAVLATKDKLKPGEALNLGSGEGTTFREIAYRTAKIIGRTIDVINDPTKPEGVFARVADATKFKALYPKELTPLDTGIERVIEGLTIGTE